ncbi:MAG: SufE family protein [Bacteroidia bacterium]|nr:SufE family protein [Bacteroidia bacterium]
MVQAIKEIEQDLVEEFELFDDWMDKYQYIIEMGQALEGLEELDKNPDNIVKGCVSQVWLTSDFDGDKVKFKADSDAVITKGLIAMLVKVLSDHSPKEILEANLEFIDQVGIRQHLSPNRSNGLSAMIKKMKFYALAYQNKANS